MKPGACLALTQQCFQKVDLIISPAGQVVVTATHLTNKHANRTQKKEKDEAGLEIESVEENKKLKSNKVYKESATTKTKLTKELGSPTQLESPTEESNYV